MARRAHRAVPADLPQGPGLTRLQSPLRRRRRRSRRESGGVCRLPFITVTDRALADGARRGPRRAASPAGRLVSEVLWPVPASPWPFRVPAGEGGRRSRDGVGGRARDPPSGSDRGHPPTPASVTAPRSPLTLSAAQRAEGVPTHGRTSEDARGQR